MDRIHVSLCHVLSACLVLPLHGRLLVCRRLLLLGTAARPEVHVPSYPTGLWIKHQQLEQGAGTARSAPPRRSCVLWGASGLSEGLFWLRLVFVGFGFEGWSLVHG